MPEMIEEFAFRYHENRKDQFSEWLDGRIRKFVKGIDFTCKTQSFRQRIYQVASARGISVRTSAIDDNTVIVQAILESNGSGS